MLRFNNDFISHSMLQRKIIIDQHHTYQLNFNDHCQLKQYLDSLLSGDYQLVKKAHISWNKYDFSDFRYDLAQSFASIQHQLLYKHEEINVNKKAIYYPANFSYKQLSNIDMQKSNFVVNQIHNLIKNTRVLMKYRQGKNKYEMSASHFQRFLQRVEGVVQMIEEEQEQFSKIQPVNEIFNSQQADKKLEKEINKIKEKSQDLQQLFNELNKKTTKPVTDVHEKFKSEISFLQQGVVSSCQQISRLKMRIEQMQQDEINTKQQIYKTYLLFSGKQQEQSILRPQLKKKQQLLSLIQKKTQSSIKNTKLLYKFNTNDPNYHEYICQKPNFLLIVQTKNNIFGAFSTSKFKPNHSSHQDNPNTVAFIFTFDQPNCLSFDFDINRVNSNKNSLVYDEEYLMIGNSDIRIDKYSSMVYSDLGSGYSCFDARPDSYKLLINSGDSRYAEMFSYECYQVNFCD